MAHDRIALPEMRTALALTAAASTWIAGAPPLRAEAPCSLAPAADEERPPGVTFDELRSQADAAAAGGHAPDSARFARAGLELNPLWTEGWWRLATLYADAECPLEARDALRRLVSLEPQSGRGWALMGVSELRLGEHGPALAHLRRAMGLGLPEGDLGQRALAALAAVLVRGGDYTAAVQLLPMLMRGRPDDPELVAIAGLMTLRIRKTPAEVAPDEREMVELAGRAAQATFAVRIDEARKRFEEMIARYPARQGVRLAYALVLSRDDPGAAMAQLRREAELFPANAEAPLEIAFELLDRGDPREALAPARRAVELAPHSHSSHLALGRALLATGSVDDAIAELERSAAISPSARDTYVALAQAYARAGRAADLERARRTLQELDARRGAGKSS